MTNLLAKLTSLETELHHNGTRCDPARVEELLHPDFFEVGKSGRVYDRAMVISFLASQTEAPPTHSDSFDLKKLSENTALLTYRSATRLSSGNLTEHALRSSIWSYTNERWQLLYHQGTLAAEPW